MRHVFADCELDTDTLTLTRRGLPVTIEPQVFDLIRLLAENPGRVVTRDEIIEVVWKGRIVSDSAISARIAAARKAVGDDGKQQAVIRTVAKRGLQLIAPAAEPLTDRPGASDIREPRIRYTPNDQGQSIAYALSGSGPRLVRFSATPTDIEIEWSISPFRSAIQAISEQFTLLRFDPIGYGLSDRNLDRVDPARDAEDCRAVLDALGWDRVAIFSESGAVMEAVHFAAKYPERVSRFVILGGYAEGRLRRQPKQTDDTLRSMLKEGWSQPDSAFARAFSTVYLPEGPVEVAHGLTQLMQSSCSPETMLALRDSVNNASIVDLLPAVQCPTLIVHGRHDGVHPLSEAQKLAAGIPDSELLVLDTANHLPVFGHRTWDVFLSEFCRFLEE